MSLLLVLMTGLLNGRLAGSDHADMPQLATVGRNDARITDLYAFREGNYLVMAMCLNPAVPPSVQEYVFSSDLVVEFHIDNKSEVSFADTGMDAVMGGTIVNPAKINDGIVIRVTFDPANQPRMKCKGLSESSMRDTVIFTGLRDDPFIRAPREGRNVAAIVIAVPFAEVLHKQSTLLIWGTSSVPESSGRIADQVGRALRSMFIENEAMNVMSPSEQFLQFGMVPDVMIYDTDRPAAYPNGRELTDDVVDLVADSRVLGNDSPFPTENDVPFLDDFPYLAPPHPAP